MHQDELNKVLELHTKWLQGEEGGVRANLQRANLRGANLRKANLQDADLQYANLQDADLQYANLQGATLYGADLQDANLHEANLQGVDLRGADLRRADLRRANLQEANLDFSCWPLHCGSKDVKVDIEQAKQLLLHIVWLDCPNLHNQAFMTDIKNFIKDAKVIKRHELTYE
jgi:uncharacterized protein YjbI with pentapeptide repeats